MAIADLLDTIGDTPLLRIPKLGRPGEGEVLLKYERYNPGGSVKDRPAKYIVEEAERAGLLQPGGTIIESSSGNFGISLAMIGAAKGYRVVILADPKTTAANLAVLQAFGAEVIVVTEKDDCGSYHKTRIAAANKLAEELPGAYRPDQCFNLLNSEAHHGTTAREIVEGCPPGLGAFVTAVSTGGQLGGISRYLKRHAPGVRIAGVDAVGSAIFGGPSAGYRIPGIGLGWTPTNIDVELVDEAYKIPDEQAFVAARTLARREGILVGPSSGACLVAALHLAQRMRPGEYVVCMVADGGERYLQTLFDEDWMRDQGFALEAEPERIRTWASELRPWSTQSAEMANYRHELTEELAVPASTLRQNDELLGRMRRERLG
ncbi:cysteine synthase family protein [Paenibacillus sp. IB182496]|uniref:Cysteine synthase n=1 Tax=Paenibacillus sabuli TaxID=2772509 RepID=A0A927BXZ6_9BACL|nr:cysteine synthase family protein [Paenibacillus sabuli]MBD2847675.1 cysteine synthase family protein [Paenibacillus sabuli]